MNRNVKEQWFLCVVWFSGGGGGGGGVTLTSKPKKQNYSLESILYKLLKFLLFFSFDVD